MIKVANGQGIGECSLRAAPRADVLRVKGEYLYNARGQGVRGGRGQVEEEVWLWGKRASSLEGWKRRVRGEVRWMVFRRKVGRKVGAVHVSGDVRWLGYVGSLVRLVWW